MSSRVFPIVALVALLGVVALVAWCPRVPPAEGRWIIPIPRDALAAYPGGQRWNVAIFGRVLPPLWTRSMLRRRPDGTIVGDYAESWNKSQITLVAVNPKGRLPDGRPYSLPAVKNYLERLRGRQDEFLKRIHAIEEINDWKALLDTLGARPFEALTGPGPVAGDGWRRLHGQNPKTVCVLKLSIEGWDSSAGVRVREILGADVVPSRAEGNPEPVQETRGRIRFKPRRFKSADGKSAVEEDWVWSPAGQYRDWRSCESSEPPPDSPSWAFEIGLVEVGPYRIAGRGSDGGVHFERRADAPETDLPPSLVLPFREDLPLGGIRSLPESSTIVEVSPVEWPAPGTAANREEPGTLRRSGGEIVAVIFDAPSRLVEEPEIRRGLAASIRRTRLLQEVYRGRGHLVASVFPSGMTRPDPPPPIPGLDDPIAAGMAFAEAGFTRTDALPGAGLSRNGLPLEVELVTPGDRPDLAAVAARVARDWTEAGVRVRLVIHGVTPRRWTAPDGTARACIRALDADRTPATSYGNTPRLQELLPDMRDRYMARDALGDWAPDHDPGRLRLNSIARTFSAEIAGVPLCRPDREFRLVPAPTGPISLNDRLADVIDALPPPAPAAGGEDEPLPPFLR
ncbi:MAG: hypothetical protein HYY93_07870 [Planctomycetes bacterium]|nr:hypothetical protein [Planctomycetota bacterium]